MAQGAPVQSARQKLKERAEKGLLVEQLKKFDALAAEGETDRRAVMRKGNKLFRGQMWEDGISSGKLAITANQSVALCERFLATIARARPIFEVESVKSNDDDAARLVEGGLVTNFARNRMSQTIKSGGRLAMFTYPVLWYSYFDTDALGGKGDMATRVIPPHRCLIDASQWYVKDMAFAGFTEEMSRAKLIMLFPDHAAEIERSADSALADEKPGIPRDPFSDKVGRGGAGATSRVVADNQGVFTAKTTVKVGGTRKAQGLAQKVNVRFLWFDDPTPVEEERVKRDHTGQPIMRARKHPETGEYQFEQTGFKIVPGPYGPRTRPALKLQREPVLETVVKRKYAQRRHVAWIPDETEPVILWDVDWDGPTPLVTQRINLPMTSYWLEGPALRLSSLAIARNILYTIIFQRLKLSLSGTWLATSRSGLRRDKLNPEDGQVFYAKAIGQDDIKQFPVSPVDPAYFQLLNLIESEMMKLVGLSEPLRGNATGRADSSGTYEALIEQGGVAVVDAAQLLEQSLEDWARINLWLMAKYYTSEHFVQFEDDDGLTSWKQCHAVAVRGEFAISVEPGSMFAHSESSQLENAKEASAMGFYALPMLGKIGRVRGWRRGLKQKMAIMADPTKQFLLGPAGAPPGKSGTLPSSQKRSHHGPAKG